MTTTKVQMPDGRLLSIEGGDAESIAAVINKSLGGSAQVSTNGEAPLAMPVLNFDKAPTHAAAVESNEEAPLALPALM